MHSTMPTRFFGATLVFAATGSVTCKRNSSAEFTLLLADESTRFNAPVPETEPATAEVVVVVVVEAAVVVEADIVCCCRLFLKQERKKKKRE